MIDFYKSIRDPLYGFIDLTKLELSLIDTKMFRRLHRIKQLSHAYLAYPSATHTRFEHSLGTLHLSDRIAVRLDLTPEKREIVRLAALLHDIGHGPFSHLFEEVLLELNGNNVGHEKVSSMFIREDEQISDILGDKAEMVAQLLGHEQVDGWTMPESTLASDIVSGPLDADKMDYLRRDSYHVGVEYARFDLDRLVRTITCTGDAENSLCIDSKGMDSVENYRLGRYLMHTQVYHHHARLVGDRMFIGALNMALGDTVNKDMLTLGSDHREFLDYYAGLDDYSICDMIMKCNGPASDLLGDVGRRALLKRAVDIRPNLDITSLPRRESLSKKTQAELDETAREIAKDVGLEQHKVILYTSRIPMKLYGDAFAVMYKGVPRSMGEMSPILTRPGGVARFYAFCPADKRQEVKSLVEERFGLA